MMTAIKRTCSLLSYNLWTFVIFEVIYSIVGLLISPIFVGLVNLGMKLSGQTYIGDDNLIALAKSPGMIFAIVLSLVVLAIYVLTEVIMLATIVHASAHQQKIVPRQAVLLALPHLKRMVTVPSNYRLVPMLLFLMPLVSFDAFSDFAEHMTIPDFIIQDVVANKRWLTAAVVVLSVLAVLALLRTFVVHVFVVEGVNFGQACKRSRKLVLANKGLVLGATIIWILFSGVADFIRYDGFAAVFDLLRGAVGEDVATPFVVGGTMVVDLLFSLFNTIMLLPISYCWMMCAYYRCLERTGEEIPAANELPEIRDLKHFMTNPKKVLAVVGVVAAIALLAMKISTDNFVQGIRQYKEPSNFQVLAHRAGGHEAPENTMAAIENSIAEGADWVEIDINQTTDGVLVIMHDSSTLRTTGVDLEIDEVTWDQLKDLDNGSFYSPEYSYVRICKLEDALATCKGKINMNIEVKPSTKVPDTERKLVEMINEYDMADQCYVASRSLESLKKAKEADPNIKTLYDMAIAYGDISSIPYVDDFSVDDFFVTPQLIKGAHNAGKTIFAWTVDDVTSMTRLGVIGIDGIVTNETRVAQAVSREYGIDKLQDVFAE